MTNLKSKKTLKRVDFGRALGHAILQAMERDRKVFIYGEGINDPNGFFGSTEGIARRFSEERCFDVPNSEEALAGIGVGAALLGYRPIFVNLRMEFLLLAMNQVVNHAARWSSMTAGQTSVPFTIRAMVGKGWGQAAQHAGGFHSLFSGIPGLKVVMPSGMEDGPGLLLASIFSDSPTIFIESKPLYDMEGDLALPIQPVELGRAECVQAGSDISLIAVSYMVEFAKSAAKRLKAKGIRAEIINLRTVSPLDEEAIVRSVAKTRRAAVLDIGWPRFGLASEISRVLCQRLPAGLAKPLLNITRKDEHTPASCFLEYEHYPREEEALKAILALFP